MRQKRALNISKRILFVIVMTLMAAANIHAGGLPTDGRVHYFDFNGNLKDQVTGKSLRVETKADSIKNKALEYLKTDNGRALVVDRYFVGDINICAAVYPELSIVMRIKMEDMKNGSTYLIGTPGDYNRSLLVSDDGSVVMSGYADSEAGRYQHVYSDESLLGQWTTVIVCYKAKGYETQVIVGDKRYSYVQKKGEDDKGRYSRIYLGAEGFRGLVSELAIYNRILTPEEQSMIAGADISNKSFKSGAQSHNNMYWLRLMILPLVLYIPLILLWYMLWRRRKLYPYIDGSYIASLAPVHNTEQTRAEAVRLLDEARQHWGWRQRGDGSVECHYPEKRGQMKQSRKAFEQALATGCDDEQLLEEYNQFAAVHNEGMQYSFRGYTWIPLLTLLALFIAYFLKPLITGSRDSAGVLLLDTFFNVRALFFYFASVVYLLVCLCPNYISHKGEDVADTEGIFSKVKAGSAVAGVAVVAAAGAGIALVWNLLAEALAESSKQYKVYINGVFSHTTEVANPVGMLYFLVPLAIICVAVYLLSFAFLGFLLLTPFVRMFINYVVKN